MHDMNEYYKQRKTNKRKDLHQTKLNFTFRDTCIVGKINQGNNYPNGEGEPSTLLLG